VDSKHYIWEDRGSFSSSDNDSLTCLICLRHRDQGGGLLLVVIIEMALVRSIGTGACLFFGCFASRMEIEAS